MADAYHDTGQGALRADRYQAEAPRGAGGGGGRMGNAVNWTGGLLSLALIAGTAVWGYKLLVRDVTGVPVVRALEGPIRVAPEDPGGTRAEHQGLSVNEVAAAGSAGGPVDRVILAPAPLELAAEDLPRPRLPQPDLPAAPKAEADSATDDGSVADVPEDALATDRAVAEALQPDPDLPELTGDGEADVLALADVLSDGVTPLSESRSPPEAAPEMSRAVARNDDLGLSRSPRPPARPAALARAGAATPGNVEPTSAEITAEVSPESLPSGTRLVQLGAFDSAETARSQWDRIGGRFEDYFVGKSRVVQRAQSGGKTFYRLRAMGFEDLADARRFCSALLAKNADCIPVVVR